MTLSDFLPATQPRITDVKDCDNWLASATLAEPRQACTTFRSLLEELELAPPAHCEYLRILERLRRPMLGALHELTKRFTAKPLPLGRSEALAFRQVCELWEVQLRSYRRLLRAGLKPTHPDLGSFLPLLAARLMDSAGGVIVAHCLARQRIAGDPWQVLHGAYVLAETDGLLDQPVGDRGLRESASAAYVEALLISLASQQGLAARELQWLRRWTKRWAHKVGVLRNCADAGQFAVDLSGQSGPTWRNDAGTAIRFLDTSRLGRTLRKRIQRLDLGEDPNLLGLGSDIAQPIAGELLATLLRQWCAAPGARKFPRRPSSFSTSSAGIDVAVGITAAHVSISGKEFPTDKKAWEYTPHDVERIHVFRRVEAIASRNSGAPDPKFLESWMPLDESAEGFKLQRRTPGARVAVRQLVSLRPRGARHFILAVVRWTLQEQERAIVMGVRALPGLARACAARLVGDHPIRPEPYTQAFLLPTGAGLPASLVLPSGWYQRDRMLEVDDGGGATRIRLTGLLGRGFDYDWAHFNTVD